MYHQFVSSEGNKLKTLVIASLAAGAHGRDISKHIHHLKKLKNCRQIKSRYRNLALHHHPDKEGGSEPDFVRLTKAKDEALESCSNDSARPKVKVHTTKSKTSKHGGSAKKRAKRARKKARKANKKGHPQSHKKGRDKARKKGHKKGYLGETGATMLAGALVVGGIEMTRRARPRGRLRRMNSDENYQHLTGHRRRQGGSK
tara:strand:+ start:484 stop:1086 length:603 start_codon:yes stop_codon:yes gene_type:complete